MKLGKFNTLHSKPCWLSNRKGKLLILLLTEMKFVPRFNLGFPKTHEIAGFLLFNYPIFAKRFFVIISQPKLSCYVERAKPVLLQQLSVQLYHYQRRNTVVGRSFRCGIISVNVVVVLFKCTMFPYCVLNVLDHHFHESGDTMCVWLKIFFPIKRYFHFQLSIVFLQ